MTTETKYSLSVQNNSNNFGRICIFQTLPDQPDNIVSLAWLCKAAHPNTRVDFEWTTKYNFVWSEQGSLKDNVRFKAAEIRDTNPADITCNSIGLVKESDAYHFVDTERTTRSGRLGIYTDESVPHGEAIVGIGMSGSGTFVVNATPNYDFIFQPHPKYWIAFGDYQTGDVMDIESMSGVKEIEFETGIYEMSVTLGQDNLWTINS